MEHLTCITPEAWASRPHLPYDLTLKVTPSGAYPDKTFLNEGGGRRRVEGHDPFANTDDVSVPTVHQWRSVCRGKDPPTDQVLLLGSYTPFERALRVERTSLEMTPRVGKGSSPIREGGGLDPLYSPFGTSRKRHSPSHCQDGNVKNKRFFVYKWTGPWGEPRTIPLISFTLFVSSSGFYGRGGFFWRDVSVGPLLDYYVSNLMSTNRPLKTTYSPISRLGET